MEIDEYRHQFIDELRFKAEHEGSEPETQFITTALDELEAIGELNDPIPMSIEMKGQRGRIMAFDAYAYDDADASIILIASDFSNERDNASSLTNTRINELYTRMRNFLDEAVNGNISAWCDDSDEAISIAKEFKKHIGKGLLSSDIMRFKFYIISDSTLSKQVKSVAQDDFLERPVELNVWTIERFYQTFASNASEVIEFDTADFGCNGIQCLKADLGTDTNYDAYMGIVPGEFLAKIYLKYGSKLLQGNIRAFLSVRGHVNKGIRRTIIESPSNFFTYNNGIAIVARSVSFSPDGSKIIHFKDPQIINGGQTTASLANAIIRKEAKLGMDTLFVPMKLTVLNVDNDMTEAQLEEYNKITKTISECANSQNAVSTADFFSNHPYHVLMEKLSQKVLAPPVDGNPFQTTWFYERSRGKWEQEQMKLTPAKRKNFCEMHPKSQVIKKEKLAKCLNAVAMNPHQVCQSATINFTKFADQIEDLYNNHRDTINEAYFKKAVCSVIMFDKLDSLVNKAPWYPRGGNKAQIVPYAIAKLFSLLPTGKDIDWKSIWQKQNLYPILANELLSIAYAAHQYLMNVAGGGIVRTISRTLATWTGFKAEKYILPDSFLRSLVSTEETKEVEGAAMRAHRFNAQIDSEVEIFQLGEQYWKKVYTDLNREELLSYGDVNFILSIANYIGKQSLPTSAQCKRLIKIVNKAEDKGYIMPKK